MLSPGTVIVSRYRVVSQIGRGGMGAVFLVEHVHTGDRAALKVLHGAASNDPESITRFKREARAPATIQSENVVRVLDADTAPELGGAPFLVMELLQGTNLQQLVAQRGPLPPAEVVRVLGQVARALDKAHAMGIVHRDLKPDNLFLHQREDGTSVVKILDFGISKTLDDAMATNASPLTRTGAVMGTPLYMSHEQALGRRDLIGPATDVWAVGLIAIYLLTGERYWQGQSVPDILAQVLAGTLYPPSSRWRQLPPAIDAWLARSCARFPEQRFRSAGEQIAALTQVFQPAVVGTAPTMLPVSSSPMTPPYVTPPHVVPPSVGASTNEPLVHSARAFSQTMPGGGMGLGLKLALILVPLLILGAVGAAALLFYFHQHQEEEQTTRTFAPPPDPTPTTTTPATTAEPALDPLTINSAAKPHPTTTATATATATATVTATATTTATVTVPTPTRAQCRASCKGTCMGASDVTECLVRCLRGCPAQ